MKNKKNHAAAAQPTERPQQTQQRTIPLMQIYHRIITVLLRSLRNEQMINQCLITYFISVLALNQESVDW